MKNGVSLETVERKLVDYHKQSVDYYAPLDLMQYKAASLDGMPADVVTVGDKEFGFCHLGLTQLCRFIGVYGPFFVQCNEKNRQGLFDQFHPQTMKEAPGKEIFFRTHAGRIRGVLSNSYGVFDDLRLFRIVKNVIGKKIEKARITSFSKDEGNGHMNISMIWDDEVLELPGGPDGKPDVFKKGISISNSEVGLGSVRIEPMLFRLICSNGLVRQMASQANLMRHFGDPDLLTKKIGGIVFNLDKFYTEMLNKVARAKAERITKIEIEKLIRETARFFQVSDRADNVIKAWKKEEGDDKMAVANAFTRAAHESYEGHERYELEVIGNNIVDMDITKMLREIEENEKNKENKRKESQEIKVWANTLAVPVITH